MNARQPQTLLYGDWVYGDELPAVDDPAELFHEASRLYPNVVDTRAVGTLLSRIPELQASASRAVRRRTGLAAVRLPDPAPALEGLDTLIGSWLRDPVSMVAIAVALAAAFWRGSTRERAAALGIALHLAMIVCAGGDFMSGRFLSVCTWTAAALWARVPWHPRAAWVAACAALAAALAAPGSPLRPVPNAGPRLERMNLRQPFKGATP